MRLFSALCAACLLFVSSPLHADASRLSGFVFDESGLPLPGALVTVLDGEGRPLTVTKTEVDGRWAVDSVPDGADRVLVQLSGFRTVTVPAEQASAPIEITLPLSNYTDRVTVTAARETRTIASVPASVGVVSGRVLEAAPGVNLAESLKFVPGVAAGNVSGVDDLRISIRGAGVRAGFGSRGVLLLADGFPVTEPDGQTPHFDGQIDLVSAERIEVVKGPASALYGGAALGGVVNVITRTPSREPRASARVEAGSYDYGKAHLSASRGAGPLVLSGTFGYTQLDGFRAHNSLRNWVGTGRADWTGASSRLVTTLLFTDASLELPGTLDRTQFEADPSQVRPIYVTNDWRRENTLVRFGGRYVRQLTGVQSLEVASYGQFRDLFHPIFVVVDQNAARYVGSARYRVAFGRHELAFGGDYDVQWVDDRWFANASGRPGLQSRDDRNTVANAGFYAQDEIAMGARVTLTLGVRGDRIQYDLKDMYSDDGDATDSRTFTRVSPRVGLTSRVGGRFVAYGNVGTGFEAPTLGEVRLPAGLNDEVRPQRSTSIEAGLRADFGSIAFDAAAYRMVVDDEILPETVDSVTVYRNVAKATHSGIEMTIGSRPTRQLDLEGSYAWSRFILTDFGAFSGNRLPGAPAHMGTVSVSYRATTALDAGVTVRFAGRAWVDDANLEAADGYVVLSANSGYRFGRARIFVRGENLGNAVYTDRPQVNDSGGFYYYPAPGRHATFGVEYRW